MADFSTRFFGGMDAQREQERLAAEELRRVSEEEQRQIERQRRNAGMNELTDRYGAVAGAPTEYGQLTGIEQRGTEFDNAQEDRDRTIQIESLQRAAAIADQMRAAGSTREQIAARLGNMPDTVFGGPERAAQARAALQDPEQAATLLAGLSGEAAPGPEYGEADFYEVGGQEVYGRPVQQPDGTVAFEELPFEAVRPQLVDENVGRDPSGIYQRDPRTGELFLVGRAPQPRGGSGSSGGGEQAASGLAANYASSVQQFNNVQSRIQEAIEKTNMTSAGSMATLLDNWFGLNQPAEDLEAVLNTVGANEVFSQIEQMRQQAAAAGSRGTGLGQITQRELELLRDVQDSVLQSQSPAALRENLANLSEQMRISMARITDEYNRFQSGGQGGGAAAPQGGITPERQALLDRYAPE